MSMRAPETLGARRLHGSRMPELYWRQIIAIYARGVPDRSDECRAVVRNTAAYGAGLFLLIRNQWPDALQVP
jgi:hypothetical protein